MEEWKILPHVVDLMFDFDARIPPGEDRAERVLLGIFHHPTVGSPMEPTKVGSTTFLEDFALFLYRGFANQSWNALFVGHSLFYVRKAGE